MTPFNAILRKQAASALCEAMREVRPRYVFAVLLRHDDQQRTFKEIGKMLGVGVERARQMVLTGERRIRGVIIRKFPRDDHWALYYQYRRDLMSAYEEGDENG